MTEPLLKPTTLTVTPIPASESRTLRDSFWVTWGAAALAVLPDLIDLFLGLMTNDPRFAEYVQKWFPAQIRYPGMMILIGYAQLNRKRRLETNAPIIGTPAATPPTPPAGEEKVGE